MLNRIRLSRILVPAPASTLAFLALLVALGPRLPAMFRTDGDVGRHVRVGRLILDEGDIPSRDFLSHTRYGAEWVPKEWLAQVAFARADRSSGLAGTATVAALLFAASVALTFGSTARLGGTLQAAVGITALSLLLQLVHVLARPHLFTTTLAAILLYILIRFRQTGQLRWVAAIPFLIVIWANSHGGFPAGLALLGLFTADSWIRGRGPDVDRQRTVLAIILALSFLGTFANPTGPAIWSHVLGHLGNSFLMGITEEFRSPDFLAPWAVPLLATILGIGLYLGAGGSQLPWLGLAILLGTLAATLVSVRHIALFAVLGLPWLAAGVRRPARSAENSGQTRDVRSPWPNRSLDEGIKHIRAHSSLLLPLLGSAVLVVTANGPLSSRAHFDSSTFPVSAMSAAGARQSGNVFNEMEWGGYLLYHYPQIQIFIDGHADFFGEPLVKEYLAVRHGSPAWAAILDQYGVEWTLTRPEAALNQLLSSSPDWELQGEDDVAAVYRRVSSTMLPSDRPPLR